MGPGSAEAIKAVGKAVAGGILAGAGGKWEKEMAEIFGSGRSEQRLGGRSRLQFALHERARPVAGRSGTAIVGDCTVLWTSPLTTSRRSSAKWENFVCRVCFCPRNAVRLLLHVQSLSWLGHRCYAQRLQWQVAGSSARRSGSMVLPQLTQVPQVPFSMRLSVSRMS
ncbi:MAG: hypothetical protein RLZZ436_3660 [Planctomycetota bacterium]